MSESNRSPACDYCGLPVAKPHWESRRARAEGPQYCCVGCRIAKAVVQERGEEGANRGTLTRLGLAVFFTMNVMVFTFALWSYDIDSMEDRSAAAVSFGGLLRAICLLMSLPVLILLGGPIIENSWRQMRRNVLSTDLLIMTAVLAAYLYSAWSVWADAGPLYFEVACMTLVFVTLGRWLEATGKLHSTEALDRLQQLLPADVMRIEEGKSIIVPLQAVRAGDLLAVQPGQRLPADGELISAAATVDEQLATGDSWPVEKYEGDTLIGGTLNLAGNLLLRVTAPPDAGTLARLIAAVREARLKQGEFQRMADRLAHWFFPVITTVASATFVVHAVSSSIGDGLLASLAVLLIACPCALGIATPMAIWTALGVAAQRGVVIRSGEILEKLATAKAIRFDKTGTLTTGSPVVQDFVVSSENQRDQVLQRAALLASSSGHVFSRAIADFYVQCSRQHPLNAPDGNELWMKVTTVPGRGAYACGHDPFQPTVLGNRQLMEDLDLEVPVDLIVNLTQSEAKGEPYALVGWGSYVRGVFTFQEQMRADAAASLDACRATGIDVGVLTGDHAGRGRRLSEQLGVSVSAGLLPEEKVREIRRARHEFGPVVMVGDGINDIPACAEADVGIAMGCGADVTRDSAGVCLVSNDLSQIPWLLDLSRKTVGAVRSNLFWAFAYNGVGVTLAALGWLHPSVAALLMVGSSLYVITNSLRLARRDEPKRPDRDHSLDSAGAERRTERGCVDGNGAKKDVIAGIADRVSGSDRVEEVIPNEDAPSSAVSRPGADRPVARTTSASSLPRLIVVPSAPSVAHEVAS